MRNERERFFPFFFFFLDGDEDEKGIVSKVAFIFVRIVGARILSRE